MSIDGPSIPALGSADCEVAYTSTTDSMATSTTSAYCGGAFTSTAGSMATSATSACYWDEFTSTTDAGTPLNTDGNSENSDSRPPSPTDQWCAPDTPTSSPASPDSESESSNSGDDQPSEPTNPVNSGCGEPFQMIAGLVDSLNSTIAELRSDFQSLLTQHNSRTSIQRGMESTVSSLTSALVDINARVKKLESNHTTLTDTITTSINSAMSGTNAVIQMHMNSVNSQLSSLGKRLDVIESQPPVQTAAAPVREPQAMARPGFPSNPPQSGTSGRTMVSHTNLGSMGRP